MRLSRVTTYPLLIRHCRRCHSATGFLSLFPGHPHFAGKLPSLGILYPSPIQSIAIPNLLDTTQQLSNSDTKAGCSSDEQREDVALQAVTGSGKTLAYLLPLMANIDPSDERLQLIVVAPTRELAVQVYGVATRLATGSKKKRKGILVERAVGRVVPRSDRAEHLAAESPHVLIGTPKTIEELASAQMLRLKGLRAVVLDEADLLLEDIRALPSIERLMTEIASVDQRPRLVYVSATMTPSTVALSEVNASTNGVHYTTHCYELSSSTLLPLP